MERIVKIDANGKPYVAGFREPVTANWIVLEATLKMNKKTVYGPELPDLAETEAYWREADNAARIASRWMLAGLTQDALEMARHYVRTSDLAAAGLDAHLTRRR